MPAMLASPAMRLAAATFRVNGQAIVPEDTNTPYSVALDITTLAKSGSKQYCCICSHAAAYWHKRYAEYCHHFATAGCAMVSGRITVQAR
jgi:hypothetical protein